MSPSRKGRRRSPKQVAPRSAQLRRKLRCFKQRGRYTVWQDDQGAPVPAGIAPVEGPAEGAPAADARVAGHGEGPPRRKQKSQRAQKSRGSRCRV